MIPQSDIVRGLRGLSGLALNALLPPRCLGCGTVVARTAALCAGCWKGVQYLEPPLCALCGFPLEYDLGPEALCGACVREPPRFDRGRAAALFLYLLQLVSGKVFHPSARFSIFRSRGVLPSDDGRAR
jgi:hypothetical protein